MPEIYTIERGKILTYSGLIDAKGLYTVIQKLFKQHSFDWNENKNIEHVYKDHKQLEMDLRPYKKISDYVMVEIKILITATDLTPIEIDIKGLKKKLYKGKLNIVFKAYLITDYESAWETKPFYYLVRMIVDKFIYKGYIHRAKNELGEIVTEVYDEIRSFLNMHRYFTPK